MINMKKILSLTFVLAAIILFCYHSQVKTTAKEQSIMALANIEALSQSEKNGWRSESMITLIDECGTIENYFECCQYEEVICFPHSGSLPTCESKSSRTCSYIPKSKLAEHERENSHGTYHEITE